MVAARIDPHIGRCAHVAIHTLCPGRALLMVVVLGGIENGRLVTAGAKRVGLHVGLTAMRVMAIGAGYTCLVHLALYERPMHEDFILDLPVGVIQAGLK